MVSRLKFVLFLIFQCCYLTGQLKSCTSIVVLHLPPKSHIAVSRHTTCNTLPVNIRSNSATAASHGNTSHFRFPLCMQAVWPTCSIGYDIL